MKPNSKNAAFIFIRCQTENEISVKENLLQTFCFQELQDGKGMDYARSFSVLLMNLYPILHYNNCTTTTLSCYSGNIEDESNDCSHLESLDAPVHY